MIQVNRQAVKDVGASERRALARKLSVISRFTGLSRVLGLARDILFVALVGAGGGIQADAFVTGFRIPNLLRDLFAEGALSAAFIPTYARVRAEGGAAEAQRFVSRLVTLLLVAMGLVVVVGIVAAPTVVGWLSPGFKGVPGKTELAVLLTRIMMPFLALVSLAAVAMGVLNAEERFGPPAMAPAMFNVVAIGVGLLLWMRGYPPEIVVVGWAVGTVLGGVMQLLVQIPDVRRLHFHFGLEWAPFDHRIREVLRLMGPATLGLAAVEVNIIFGTRLASAEQGAQTWLYSALRILYLPIGLFGVSLGTIMAAGSARTAADGDMAGLRASVRRSLGMLAFLTIPASLGLIVLAEPVVRMLFERGRFRPEDTRATAAAVVLYAVGLVAYAAVKVLAPAFYSLGRPRIAVLGSVCAVTVSVGLMYILYGQLGYRVVALATSLGAFVNCAVLMLAFERRVGGLRGNGLLVGTMRMAGAAVLMAACAWGAAWALSRSLGTHGPLACLVVGIVPVLLGVALYLWLSLRMGIPEAEALLSLVRRRAAVPASGTGA